MVKIHDVLKDYDYKALLRKKSMATAGLIGKLKGTASVKKDEIPADIMKMIDELYALEFATWEQLNNMEL